MSLWEIAKKMHEDVGLKYEDQLAYYQKNGYIYSSPRALVWAEAYKDTWLVYLAVGSNAMSEFFECMPFWLPNYAFCRLLRKDHRMKVRSMERVVKLLGLDLDNLKQRKHNEHIQINHQIGIHQT